MQVIDGKYGLFAAIVVDIREPVHDAKDHPVSIRPPRIGVFFPQTPPDLLLQWFQLHRSFNFLAHTYSWHDSTPFYLKDKDLLAGNHITYEYACQII